MSDTKPAILANRRQVLAAAGAVAAGAGLPAISAPPARAQALANPAQLGMAIRKVVGSAEVKTGKVKLDVPPLSENGNSVTMTVTVDSPMTPTDYVKAIHVLSEKNPQPNVISVKLGPRAGHPDDPDPHPACRFTGHRRDRRAERRHVLAGHRKRHHHARRLP